MCDNCRRRGKPRSRHYGKYINNDIEKYCEGCKQIKDRTEFYVDRGNTSYLCKGCHAVRRPHAKLRAAAIKYGRENVLQTSADLCVKCWQPYDSWEVDHIVPYSKGGTHDIDNLQIMCKACNRKKSNSESIDYRVFITSIGVI